MLDEPARPSGRHCQTTWAQTARTVISPNFDCVLAIAFSWRGGKGHFRRRGLHARRLEGEAPGWRGPEAQRGTALVVRVMLIGRSFNSTHKQLAKGPGRESWLLGLRVAKI